MNSTVHKMLTINWRTPMRVGFHPTAGFSVPHTVSIHCAKNGMKTNLGINPESPSAADKTKLKDVYNSARLPIRIQSPLVLTWDWSGGISL